MKLSNVIGAMFVPAFPDVEFKLVYSNRVETVYHSRIILAHFSETFRNLFLENESKTTFEIDMATNPDRIVIPHKFEFDSDLINKWTDFTLIIEDNNGTIKLHLHRAIIFSVISISFFDMTESETKLRVDHARIMFSLIMSIYNLEVDLFEYPEWFVALEKIRYKKMLEMYIDPNEFDSIVIPTEGLNQLLELSANLNKIHIGKSFIRNIENIDLSSDNKKIVAGYDNGIVSIFNIETKMVDIAFKLKEVILEVSFDRSTTRLCVMSSNSTIRIFNIIDQIILLNTIETLDKIVAAYFIIDEDEERIFAYGPNAIYIFDPVNGKSAFRYKVDRRIECATIAPNGRIAYFDGEHINIFDEKNIVIIQSIVPMNDVKYILLVYATNPIKEELLCTFGNDTCETWKINSVAVFGKADIIKNNIRNVKSNTKNIIVTKKKTNPDRLIIGIVAESNPMMIVTPKRYSFLIDNHKHHKFGKSLTKKEDFIAVNCGNCIKLFNVDTCREFGSFKYNRGIDCLDISSNNKMVAFGDNAGNVNIWNIEMNIHELIIKRSTSIRKIVFSPNNKLIAVTNANDIEILDLDTKSSICVFRHSEWILNLTFSPNSAMIACFGDEKVQVWNIKTKEMNDLYEPNVRSITFAPDSTSLSTIYSSKYSSVIISPDNKILATIFRPAKDSFGIAAVHDLVTKKHIADVCKTITNPHPQLLFHPNSKKMALATGINTIKIIDINLPIEQNVLNEFNVEYNIFNEFMKFSH